MKILIMKKIVLVVTISLFALSVLIGQKPVFTKDITVALDGSGDFKTIQAAINSVRDLGQERTIIRIKKGIYHEKLIIPSWKNSISLIGEDKENTIITNNDYSGKPIPTGMDSFGKDKFTTYTTYTVLVQANDFVAENLTIENAAGAVGQAVALHVEGDRCIIRNCKLLGNQDTLLAANEKSRQLYEDCYIEGTTDFIFGQATAVFNNCIIKSIKDSYITAAATTLRQAYGFVLLHCKLIADSSVKKVFLGRPWRPYAKVVYINCDLGKHITPEGWNPWIDARFPDKDKTAYYAEYGNTGEGASVAGRVSWSHQLTENEVKQYTINNILGGSDSWNPVAK